MTASSASHSYQGQDLFVLEVLSGLRGGFFLDSGASDGVSGSNTLLLETRYGWGGLCVEPNTQLFARLIQTRRCTAVNCCLYNCEGEVPFFEAAGVLGGIVAEYDPALLQQAEELAAATGSPLAAPVQRPARRIGSLLDEIDAPRVIDYWSLDTEGSELAILRSFPWGRYGVRVLTVEHNRTARRWEIRRFLEAQGFRVAGDLGIDDVYVHFGLVERSPWRSAARLSAQWPRPSGPAY